MSTAQDQRIVNFGKGLFSGTSRFAEPQGSVPRGSNLIWLRRGAMRTTDGSIVISSLNGAGPTLGQFPFRWMGRYAPSYTAPLLLALQVGGGNTNLVDVSATSWAGALATYPTVYATPSFVQAEDTLAIALGPDTVPQLYNAIGGSVAITNSWNGIANIGAWVTNTLITKGSPIVPTVPNGHVYVAQTNGTTSAAEPVWPVGLNSTILDNNILWQESGPDAPPVPPGAASIFFHGGYLFLWGTSATYQADNLNGPDTLAQSDLLDFNSWNPLNMTFVGKGDGTKAMGGGVLTLSETGIAATAQLVLFKETDTYLFLGYFPNWSLTKAPSGVGCVAPGTVQFLADFGLIRLSYRGVAMFDGQDDVVDELTDPIRSYLFGDDEPGIVQVDWSNINLAIAAQMDNPKMYLLAVPLIGSAGALTRIFAYDVGLKAWATPIDLPWGIASLAYIPTNHLFQRTLLGGFENGTIEVFANNCSATWAGTPVSWSLRTPEIGAPETPVYIRRVNLRGQGVYGTANLTSAIMNYQDRQGNIRQKTLIVPPPPTTVTCSLDVDVTCLSANFDIAGTGRALLEGLGYQYTPKRPERVGGGLQITSLEAVVTMLYQQGGSVTVGANLQAVTVILPVIAPNANYLLTVTPNWNTTFWVSGKTVLQFVVYFNTPAPPDGSGAIDWSAEILQ